jgi:hypothetical protein
MTSPQNSSPLLTQVFIRSPRMVGRRVAGEYILVPIAGRGAEVDAIFNLNGVAAFIWEQFDGRQDGHRIVTKIAEQFDVDHVRAQADYLEFAGKLLSIGALVEGTGSESLRSP